MFTFKIFLFRFNEKVFNIDIIIHMLVVDNNYLARIFYRGTN